MKNNFQIPIMSISNFQQFQLHNETAQMWTLCSLFVQLYDFVIFSLRFETFYKLPYFSGKWENGFWCLDFKSWANVVCIFIESFLNIYTKCRKVPRETTTSMNILLCWTRATNLIIMNSSHGHTIYAYSGFGSIFFLGSCWIHERVYAVRSHVFSFDQ